MVFVDVGGGRSRQCVALRNEFPRLKGRFVLQDLREAVEGLEMEGVEVQVGNFWGDGGHVVDGQKMCEMGGGGRVQEQQPSQLPALALPRQPLVAAFVSAHHCVRRVSVRRCEFIQILIKI